MRARAADIEGFVDRDGVKVAYAVYGDGPVTVLLGPSWAIVDSQMWKAQVPFLARHFRVITVDPRGNGRSDRPTDPAAYADTAYADDLVAVLDAVGADRAVVAGLCSGAWWATVAVARHPERFDGLIAFAPAPPWLAPPLPEKAGIDFDAEHESHEGWAKYNRRYWLRDFPDFARFFFEQMFPEPHSTKPVEDSVGWALQTTPETLVTAHEGSYCVTDRAETEALLTSVRVPVLTIRGTDDRCQPEDRMRRYAELTGARQHIIEGAGHLPMAREPVTVNRWMYDFITEVSPRPLPTPRRWTRPRNRPPRALYLSSPIGLGHARRDLAIADELRRLRPDLTVDWLTQHPVTAFLQARGERVHPASAHLASETAHIESESGEHDLHAFQAVRRMDEILVANFMVFDDLLRDEGYDVVIGDEAWDVDYFLHENPELKRCPFVWLTDFVGWLPMPSGGEPEAALTADSNAEMIEQVQRYPRLRDRSLFVGNPDDIVPDTFGPGLPTIRDWTEQRFDFTGYVSAVAGEPDRERLRAELGYADGETVCVVSVGGSGVGEHLLRRVVAAHDALADRVPGLRLVVVTGPRIDPTSIGAPAGVAVHGFVPDLDRHLAACDVAIVQGGLTTTMELAGAGRPFVYVPLRNHFEQNRHVRHRLERYGAGRCLPYDEVQPDRLAEAVAGEIDRAPMYRPVETTGAATAAGLIAELI